MSQRALYIVVAILAIAVVVLGFAWYQEANTNRVDIKLGNGGLSIQSD